MDTSTGSPNDPLTLVRVNDGVFNVLDPHGLYVGNLKLIAGCWKFKAVGHGPDGELVPGGDLLPKLHNTVFDRPDTAEVGAGLGY